MFVIQFDAPFRGIEYVVEITDKYIDDSRSINNAKEFTTEQAAAEYCKKKMLMQISK